MEKNKPDIPEKTLEEMKQFFLKTSIPKIIEAKKEKKPYSK